MPEPENRFFVGYLPVPRPLARFLLAISAAALALALLLGLGVSATQRDPGDGSFRWDWGRQTVTGVLRERPYPTLTVTEGTERFPEGRTIILGRPGKNGAVSGAAGLDGRLVRVSGISLKRGDLDMIEFGRDGLELLEGTPASPEEEDLGRWRLTGEICDGKCYAGAMRPGTGLAHKACANLCLIGDVAPVFVATGPVEGRSFFLLGEPGGARMGPWMLAHTAELIEIEGRVRRRGDLLLFLADPDTLAAPR